MKKLFFLLAGMFLLSGSLCASTGNKTSTASDLPVVTLTFEFYQGPEGFRYTCRNAPGWNVEVIDMWIHNVNLDKNGYNDYGVTAWVQSQVGGEYSEVVPGTLTPDSYVDLSTIQIQTASSPICTFKFHFIGIDAR